MRVISGFVMKNTNKPIHHGQVVPALNISVTAGIPEQPK